MIYLVPVISLIIGVVLGAQYLPAVGNLLGQYLGVAALAGLDSVCGGVRSGLEGKFHLEVFLSGFVANVIIAFFLAWLGDRIFQNLFLAVAVVFGGRIFLNLSLIRRFLLTKWQDALERKRQKNTQRVAAQVESNG